MPAPPATGRRSLRDASRPRAGTIPDGRAGCAPVTDSARRDLVDRPVVAVLAAHWGSGGEERWFTRQVAGALACVADVHIICPDGRSSGTSTDGVFTLHRLGTPIDPVAELRRDLIIEALASTGSDGSVIVVPDGVGDSLDDGLIEPWRGADDALAELSPDLVVLAGHRNLGALRAIDRQPGSAPVVLVTLALPGQFGTTDFFDPLVERAARVITVTEDERQDVVRRYGRAEDVHRVGAPLAANSSVLVEPNSWVGDTEYLFVNTGIASGDTGMEAELSRLLRLRFDDRPVGVSYTDGFFVWHEGRRQTGWPVERSSDLARLMAWARVTVDLHPGELFARSCVESLLYGTPIVVPGRSRAREYAHEGGGGLWFDDPAELTWGVECLLETDAGPVLARQGRAYAEAEFGSTDRFIERVVRACGLESEPAGRLEQPTHA